MSDTRPIRFRCGCKDESYPDGCSRIDPCWPHSMARILRWPSEPWNATRWAYVEWTGTASSPDYGLLVAAAERKAAGTTDTSEASAS